MTPTQDFENYPEFANAGQKSQPNDAKYAAGFIPSDVLPAEWLNWFLNGATKGVTALNTGVKSIEQEINAVLESRAVTPNINAAGQLLSVLNKIKAEAVLAAHPVGSLYWTSKKENPAVTFGGGTWKQIEDCFILAAGSTYKVEATGGKKNHTLTVDEMPSHSHTFTPSGSIKIIKNPTFSGVKITTSNSQSGSFCNAEETSNNATGIVSATKLSDTAKSVGDYYRSVYKITINTSHSHTFTPQGTINDGSYKFDGVQETTLSSGSGTAFSIMPPYIVKYCWERTA